MRCQWKPFKRSLEEVCNAHEKIGTSVVLQLLGKSVSGVTCRQVYREEKILHVVLQVIMLIKQHLGNAVSVMG